MSRNQLLSIAVTVGCLAGLAPERAAAQDLTTVRITTGFSLPLYACSPPGDADRLFVVQQRGRIRIIDLGTNSILPTDFLNLTGIASTSGNERGLLGLAFHPNYAVNGKFYVSYTAQGASGASRVVEYTVSGNPNVANPTPGPTIFGISQPFSNHNGGCIQFGPDGKLYVAMGDGGSGGDPGNRAQNITNNLGKMLRFDVDIPAPYIPGDNPFVGVAGNDEIWAYGLRNPWRFSFDRLTGDMYIGDVGQNAWEEVDFQPASSTGGENYGWRCREGAHPFNTAGCPPTSSLVDPIWEFSHSFGCSITGGYVYRGAAIPGLQGTYFTADYCSNRIWSFRYDGTTLTEETVRQGELAPPVGSINSITSFGEDGAGELYIVDQGGEIYKIIEDVPPCVGSTMTYCVTSPNGSGPGAQLFDASGSLDISDNDFGIAVGGATPNNFGIFFYGLGAQPPTPQGNGQLCVDTTLGLFRVYPVVPIDFIGLGVRTFDFNATPMDSGAGQILPGTSYYFQFWYRDPMGTPTDYNFSDALQAIFCP